MVFKLIQAAVSYVQASAQLHTVKVQSKTDDYLKGGIITAPTDGREIIIPMDTYYDESELERLISTRITPFPRHEVMITPWNATEIDPLKDIESAADAMRNDNGLREAADIPQFLRDHITETLSKFKGGSTDAT
jgi:hypothetical protein